MTRFSYNIFFKALYNETRFRIITFLKEGPRSVTQISYELNLEQSHVSHALQLLARNGLADFTWQNGYKKYFLNEEVLELLNQLENHKKIILK